MTTSIELGAMALRDNDWYANDALTSADLSRIVLESIDTIGLAEVIDPEPFGHFEYPMSVHDARHRRAEAIVKAHVILAWLTEGKR